MERRGINPDMAVRLARFFETTEPFWLNLQSVDEVGCGKQPKMAASSHGQRPRPVDA